MDADQAIVSKRDTRRFSTDAAGTVNCRRMGGA